MKRGDMGHMGNFSYYSNNYSFFSLTVNSKNDLYSPYAPLGAVSKRVRRPDRIIPIKSNTSKS